MDENHDRKAASTKKAPERTLLMVISTVVGFVFLIILMGWVLLANGCYVIGSL